MLMLAAGLLAIAGPRASAAEADPVSRPATPASAPGVDPLAGWRSDKELAHALGGIVHKLEFDDIQLGDIVQFTRDISGLTIAVDWGYLSGTPKIGRTDPVTIKLTKVTVAVALREILAKVKLDYIVLDGAVVVSTRERLASLVKARQNRKPWESHANSRARELSGGRKLEVAFDDVTFEDAVAALAKMSGVKIVPGWAEAKPPAIDKTAPVNLRVSGLELDRVLNLLILSTDPSGKTGYAVFGREVVILSRTILDELAPRPPATRPAHRPMWDKTFEHFQYNRMGLENMIILLRAELKTGIFVRWDVLEKAGIRRDDPILVDLKNVTGREVFRAVLEAAGQGKVKLDFAVVEGDIVISTLEDLPRAATQPWRPWNPPGILAQWQDDPALRKRLAARINVLEFDDVPLSDVIHFLRDVSGLQIMVRWHEMALAGIDKTVPVSIALHDVTVQEALRTVCRDMKFSYVIVDSVIVMSTTDDLIQMLKRDIPRREMMKDLGALAATQPATEPAGGVPASQPAAGLP